MCSNSGSLSLSQSCIFSSSQPYSFHPKYPAIIDKTTVSIQQRVNNVFNVDSVCAIISVFISVPFQTGRSAGSFYSKNILFAFDALRFKTSISFLAVTTEIFLFPDKYRLIVDGAIPDALDNIMLVIPFLDISSFNKSSLI